MRKSAVSSFEFGGGRSGMEYGGDDELGRVTVEIHEDMTEEQYNKGVVHKTFWSTLSSVHFLEMHIKQFYKCLNQIKI